MTYDGRYRLGCEGILYILIEPFYISEELYRSFSNAILERTTVKTATYYCKEDDARGNFGSSIHFQNSESYNFSKHFNAGDSNLTHSFQQA